MRESITEGPLTLLGGECTVRERIVRAGLGLIFRRLSFSHTQSTFYGEGGFIEHASRGCAGDCKRRIGRPAYKGGGDVIADHKALSGVWEPGERHGSSNMRIRGPRGSPISRGRESHLQLAGDGGAVRIRVEVEG